MARRISNLIIPYWAKEVAEHLKWYRLHDVCDDIVDCPHSTPKLDPNGSYFLARSQDIREGYFKTDQAAKVSVITYIDRTKRSAPSYGDLLYSREGTYFGIAALLENDITCLGQRMVLLRPNHNMCDSKYLKFWLNSPLIQRHIHGFRDGSVAERLNLSTIRGLPVALPSIKEQEATVAILGALDEKIDLNRRMNQTLESMARTIFKSWFVDFDRCTEFQDSELGKIPKGWEVRPLSELCKKSQYGYTASANEDEIGPKFLRIKDINKFDWIEWTTVPYCDIKQKDKEKYKLYPGDIVVARMADPGHAALIEEHVDSVFASYLIRFRPLADYHERYLQYWFRSDFYWNLITGRQTGSTRANINAKVLGSFPVLVPHIDEVKSFKIMIDPIRERVVANVNESNTLAKLRDTLLPKLISGELLVPDAEKLAGEML